MVIHIAHSFKGGSGKTLLSTNLAFHLVEAGKSTLLIEADFAMPTFKKIFPDHNPDIYFNNYLNQNEHGLDYYIYPSAKADLGIIYCDDNFRSSDKVFSSDQSWFLDKMDQLRADIDDLNYDHIIFDLSPGFHFFTINTLMMTSEVYLMMRPDYHSFESTLYVLKSLYVKATRVHNLNLHVVINQIPEHPEMQKLVDEWAMKIRDQFNFIDTVLQWKYETDTAYNTAINEFILPPEDPTYEKIKQIAAKL